MCKIRAARSRRTSSPSPDLRLVDMPQGKVERQLPSNSGTPTACYAARL